MVSIYHKTPLHSFDLKASYGKNHEMKILQKHDFFCQECEIFPIEPFKTSKRSSFIPSFIPTFSKCDLINRFSGSGYFS